MLILAILSLLLAAVALVLVVRMQLAGPPEAVIPEGAYGSDLPGLRAEVAELRSEVAALGEETVAGLQHIAIVRYDAFGDVGGQLSWSLVIADGNGDGLLLTSIHGRTEGRSYVKALRGWACSATLSPQEEAALKQARPGDED